MSINVITDFSILASQLSFEKQVVREFYLITVEKIWGIDPYVSNNTIDLHDKISNKFKQNFTQWKGWLNENDFSSLRLDRVKRLIQQIKETKYETDPADNRLVQVWKRFLQTFGTQVKNDDLTQKTYESIKNLAEKPSDWVCPKFEYGNGERYEGGDLPVGFLTPYPYAKDEAVRKENERIDNASGSIWREMQFLERFINLNEVSQSDARKVAEDFQMATYRWLRGEEYMWNRFIQYYAGAIGDEPKNITEQVDSDDTFKKMGMEVFVTAHKLPSGAEVLSIAVLPQKAGEKMKVHIDIPNRWGAPQITSPQDPLQFLKGTCKEGEGVIIYGRRLELAEEAEDYRPQQKIYRQTVNPIHKAFKIYENFITADTSEFTAEVQRVYGKLKKSQLEADFIWATEIGAIRLIADLAADQNNHSPFVLMNPAIKISVIDPHWSYMGPWMGVGVDYKGEIVDEAEKLIDGNTQEGRCTLEDIALKSVRETLERIKVYKTFSRKDVEEETNIFKNAEKLPVIEGRKVLILKKPLFSYVPARMSDTEFKKFVAILESKKYQVTVVQPTYTSQEDPVPGYRYYPELGNLLDAKEWFEKL